MRSLPQPIVVAHPGLRLRRRLQPGAGRGLPGHGRATRSMATPFIKRGLATGTNLLQQYVGIGKAIEMTLLGRAGRGRRGAAAGAGHRGRGAGRPGRGRRALAERLADGPSAAIGLTKYGGLPRLGPGPGRRLLAAGLGRRPGPRAGGSGRRPRRLQGEAPATFHRPVAGRPAFPGSLLLPSIPRYPIQR